MRRRCIERTMAYRRVTVLGASGLIGRYMVKRLAEQGALIAADGRHASDAGFRKPMGDVGQIATIDADVTDDAALAAVIAGADVVVNAVGILYERGAQRFDALHHLLPRRIAAEARAAEVKQVVHISAIGADPQSPASYGRSKAAGEAALRGVFPAVVVLRPSIVFGPEDAFFNRFAALARLSPVLPLIGGGTTRFQPVYVGDVADAVMAALERPEAAGRIYELGGPAVLSFRELMELMLSEIGRRRLLVSVPWGLASFAALFMQVMPTPMLTRDQVKLLQRDNVVTSGASGLADLGIAPTALALVLPIYLSRFRRGARATLRSAI